MGACASRPSDDGASTSGSDKKSKPGKPGSGASTNPARVLDLGADAESYFARWGGRAFYASPPVSATDSVPRESLPRTAVEQAVRFESADGTSLAGVVHRPHDDDVGAKDRIEDRTEHADRSPNGRRRGGADDFDDVATARSPSSPYVGTGPRRRGRNEARRDWVVDDFDESSSKKSRIIASAARGAAVALCHPHPFLGGDKDSALVVALARRLARAGVTVLRFDSRGVGQSGGTRTWMRAAEREDCEAAVRRVARARGVDRARVYAVGYGLGAAVALEASKREPSARGFVGVSYPFGAKSMLVPSAARGEFSKKNAGDGKPRFFAVAGKDCVRSAGDCDAVAASVRELPAPRSVVVVDDADHAWCGHYETLAERVVEFMEEHARATRAEEDFSAEGTSSSSASVTTEASGDADGGSLGDRARRADRGRDLVAAAPATTRSIASDADSPPSSPSSAKSSELSPEAFGARMSENEDTDDSGGGRFGGGFGGSRRVRRDAASSALLERRRERDSDGASGGDDVRARGARRGGGWTAWTVTASSDPAEVLGWEREARARARAAATAATAGGRPLGPLAESRGGDETEKAAFPSPLRSRRHSAPSSDDGQSSVGAYGDAAGGFETWEAWEEEKRRRAKMGSPGHTPAASLGSTPWQTPGHSPGHTPPGPRSVADFDRDDPVDPWALNGAAPLIRRPEDIAAQAAAKLAATIDGETERKSDGSESRSDVSALAASRASNRRLPTPTPAATVDVATVSRGGFEAHDGRGRLSRTGSRDGLAENPRDSARDAWRETSPKGTPPRMESPSASRRGSVVGSAATARPILKKTSSFANLSVSGGSGNSREGSQHGPQDARDPNDPSLLTAFANASQKLHGRPNLFRSGIRAVLAANRFVAAGEKRVQWEETTAEGRPIVDAVHRKPTRVGNKMRSAAKAVMAGNRLASFGAGDERNAAAAASPLRGQFLQKSVVEEREWRRHHKIADVRRRASESSERARPLNGGERASGGSPVSSRASSRASSERSRGSGGDGRPTKPRFSAAARAVVAGYRTRHFGAGASGAGAGAGAGAREPTRASSRSRSPSMGSRSPSVSRSGSPSRRRPRAGRGDSGDFPAGGVFSERFSASAPGSPGSQSAKVNSRRPVPAPRGSPSSSLRSSRGEPGGSRSRSRSGF